MTNSLRRGARAIAAGLMLVVPCAHRARAQDPGPVRNETAVAAENPEAIVGNWPPRSRALARLLLLKYGRPEIYDGDLLLWDEDGPWEEIEIRPTAPAGVPGGNPGEVLKQTIFYEVPAGKLDALQRFDPRLEYDPETGLLTSFAENERLNDLALNLADEIVAGKRTPDDARSFYLRTARLAESGKSSPYMEGLLFRPRAPWLK